ncbi:pentatricopeptide repeat-containing protein At5g08305 [Rhododendron vialii]|uniref:pentatricopeptide repeat-containing protein At5g08305 n=1 Tax=Rhododendron vialii TaxID=182163 RepID=UPI00265F4E32|nr:pentatricopeptide repeat-containing protein At5g08305 [Rhododendron vialii]
MLNASLLSSNANLIQTLISFLDKCKSISELKRIHSLAIAFGLAQYHPFPSRILSLAATSVFPDVDYSHRVFRQLQHPTLFNYNALIRGYSKSKNPSKSIAIFVDMMLVGVTPDHLTYPFLAKASARMGDPQLAGSVHGIVLKAGFQSDRFVANSLIHMYSSCGNVVRARKLFDEMPEKNSVSWNAMLDGYAKCGNLGLAREVFELMPERDVVSWSSLIDGYVKGGQYGEALAIFQRMKVVGPEANEVTLVSVLCACAHLGALEIGRKTHRYMIENALPLTLELRTSLVDMYAKSGAIEEALVVFRGVPLNQTDVLVWNAMIGGLATHGFVMESLALYSEMKIAGIIADEITYLCLLSACAHGGLVKEAWFFFESLNKERMTPKNEHYACMVDVLARAGQLTEAYQFLHQMPIKPTASMFGALFNGCMNHRKLDLAEIVGRKLVELEPEHDGRYIGLSNVYSGIKRWDEARTMREAMERRGLKKSPGFSFVEVCGILHRFIAHDRTHPKSEHIYMMLSIIVNDMKFDAEFGSPECELYDHEFL